MELKFTPLNLNLQEQSRPDQDLEKSKSLKAQNYSREESKDTELVLRTKQGDIVTLSSSSDFETRLSTYSAMQKNENSTTSVEAAYASMEFQSSYEISVEGDLNEQEIKDINKAIRKLDQAMHQLSKGNSDNALKKALSLTGLETVAGFEASLSYHVSEEYQYVQQSVFERVADSAKPPKLENEGKTLLETLTDELADTVNDTEVPKQNVFESVNQLFKDMMEKMEELHEDEPENPWNNFLEDLSERFEESLFYDED
jgi:CRISPR/Cas system-associated endoribonuclease Cas2